MTDTLTRNACQAPGQPPYERARQRFTQTMPA